MRGGGEVQGAVYTVQIQIVDGIFLVPARFGFVENEQCIMSAEISFKTASRPRHVCHLGPCSPLVALACLMSPCAA